MHKYKISDIQWDDDQQAVPNDLPRTVTVLLNTEAQPYLEVEDILSDWLSDTYGWLNLGFEFKKVK